ncbi:MAG: DUF433 domain-containing protein [Verrucomicrobia bacterium]|nr:DUF433 domain-containing protein [Verrucomicrobiota bacterium]
MSTATSYTFLWAEPGSGWEEWVIRGTGIRASTLVLAIRNDGRTPEEVAEDFDVPLEAVLEAIDYVDSHSDELSLCRGFELEEWVRRGHINPDGTWRSISTTTPTKIE